MEYSMEELLPIVENLTEKYTSKESSSVTYETARRLMNAVLYCLEAFYDEEGLTGQEKPDASLAYQIGYEKILARVYKAKEIYDGFIEVFYDYQCRNYSDTILKGIPQFFIRYDPKFNPQDHLLTLDYPTLRPVNSLAGINAILQYLSNIKLECEFLNAFPSKSIEGLLERIDADYRHNYFGNISYEVLLNALGCMVSEKSIGLLQLTHSDMKIIGEYFQGDSIYSAEDKVRLLISQLFQKGFSRNKEMEEYFSYPCRDYAVRIINAMESHCLENVFAINTSRLL